MPAAPTIPFEATAHVRDACLCLHTQRAARVLARRFDEALRPVGLTNGQFSLMMSLNRPAPAGMGPVAALLGMAIDFCECRRRDQCDQCNNGSQATHDGSPSARRDQ